MTKYYVNMSGAYLGGFDGAPPPAGAFEVPIAPASASDKWLGGVWVPRPIVPESVPKLNARLVLIGAGYWTDITAFFDALPGIEGEQARAYLQDALTIRRDNPLVEAWRVARGKTAAEIDGLFIAAGALNV